MAFLKKFKERFLYPDGPEKREPEKAERTETEPQTEPKEPPKPIEKAARPQFTDLNSADVMGYAIEGMHFPASRNDLVEHARSNGAPPHVIQALQAFPDQTYNTITDVAHQAKLTVEDLRHKG